jgi:preprotein translocase subunit SecB
MSKRPSSAKAAPPLKRPPSPLPVATAATPTPRATLVLPKTVLVAAAVPARIASVAVTAVRYAEHPNPAVAPGISPLSGELDLSMRAEYGWANDRTIVLTVHTDLKTPNAAVVVDVAVSLRVAFEAGDNASNTDLWEFVKEAGLRIAFPFVRTHLATITAMGSLGSVVVDPLMLAMVEPQPAP